jgi:hypothetical protein
LSLAGWYNQEAESEFKSFNTIAATLYQHYDEILNFFINRSTNASAESFNAKIKDFRASLRGVTDIKFFLFRLANIYAGVRQNSKLVKVFTDRQMCMNIFKKQKRLYVCSNKQKTNKITFLCPMDTIAKIKETAYAF